MNNNEYKEKILFGTFIFVIFIIAIFFISYNANAFETSTEEQALIDEEYQKNFWAGTGEIWITYPTEQQLQALAIPKERKCLVYEE